MGIWWRKSLSSREALQTWLLRGSKSRNKVSVGEPAEGSLKFGDLESSEMGSYESEESILKVNPYSE